jgi:hypothetical protein
VIERYVSTFRPSRSLREPLWSVCVAGVCADSLEEASALIATQHKDVRPTLAGSPQQCFEKCRELRRRYCTDEIVFADLCEEFSAKLRSYRLLAEACKQGEDA